MTMVGWSPPGLQGHPRLQAAWRGADTDADGAISRAEFRALGQRRGRAEPAVPGSRKALDNGDPSRGAAGTGRWFESIHVPLLTDRRESLNGFALADVDGNGWLDLVTVTIPPFALDETWADRTGEVQVRRTREPRDHLRLLLNQGGFRFVDHPLRLQGSVSSPDDLSQGWRGAQVPALADFDGDGFFDMFITRQAPMVAGRLRDGMQAVGCSLFVSDGAFDRFQDVSRRYGALNELVYNRQPSLGADKAASVSSRRLLRPAWRRSITATLNGTGSSTTRSSRP